MLIIETILGSYITGFVAIFILLLITYFTKSQSSTTLKRLSLNTGTILSLSQSSTHDFSKEPVDSITLIAGLGVEGDAHFGAEDQHLWRRSKPGPYGPNLRQVHFIHSELFDELKVKDEHGQRYDVKPGDLGENITTAGLDVLGLGEGTKLHFVNGGEEFGGEHAVVRVTGLRNPCSQIDKFKMGLKERCLVRDEDREGLGFRKIVKRLTGIMSVVEVGGVVRKGARIMVEAPEVYKELVAV